MHPRLLNGLSWGALALVGAFCALQALEWVLLPRNGAMDGTWADFALGWLGRFAVFMVMAATMLVVSLLVLNAAGRAGRESIGIAVLAAIAGATAGVLLRYAIGAVPADESARFLVLVFTSWIGSGAGPVPGHAPHLPAPASEAGARTAG